ncbi:glycosyltransferase family 2 protein [Citrobacter portucalensis]|uniref:glycosyltransferase family 2 protein n=1 Tax=Citrobacter portucalensis TaxID=1639133 RepID=UPI0028C35853|nr:glycosyltransferase family 2 protein [Citrobacter portucalensis]
MNYFFSIVTPSYNRKEKLQVLFASLNKQSGICFEWIIVDDGSEDDTKQTVSEFIKNKKNITNIKYIYQKNKGKHNAVNRGIMSCSGEYIVIIDSDDYLCDRALETVKSVIDKQKVSERDDIICISGVKVNKQYKPVSYIANESVAIMSHYEWFYEKNHIGDRIDFYKACVLKGTLFNNFPQEKFLTEDALWLELEGLKIFINEKLLVVDYLDGGLSSRYDLLLKNNPFGTAYYYYVLLTSSDNLTLKLKASMLIVYYIFLAIIKNSNTLLGLLSIILLPITCLIKLLKK